MPRATKRARRCRPWSDLPHDLLDDVLRRLPAFADRLRFRAVCQQWRAAESVHPCRPVPWLVAPGHCISLHDAAIHRVALPEDCRAAACRGSSGNWLALVPTSYPPYYPFLLNPFTMARILLPQWTKEPIGKIVLSSAPDSESCTVATIFNCQDCSKIAVCDLWQVGSPWQITNMVRNLQDITFFEGKLYAVDTRENMHIIEGNRVEKLCDGPMENSRRVWPLFSGHSKLYLVPGHERLLMVYRNFAVNRVLGCAPHNSCGFNVSAFEDGDKSYRWVTVKSFDGHAIFIGDACCRAFSVAASGSKIRENQICFVDDEKNTPLILGDGQSSTCPAVTVRGINGHRPFRSLQSYDVRNDCIRMYRPSEPSPSGTSSTAGPWQCVAVQRFPQTYQAMAPPSVTVSGAELLLREVMNSLGAPTRPYFTERWSGAGSHVGTVNFRIPLRNKEVSLQRSFSQCKRSVHEAKQAAAYQAVTFLRSRFRSVLDESPWSSIPYYHKHVDEVEEEEAPE